jgi:hypothetical protein
MKQEQDMHDMTILNVLSKIGAQIIHRILCGLLVYFPYFEKGKNESRLI